MFRTEEQKMRLYKANLKKEAMNQFRQGEKLQEYFLQEKGIDSQEANINRFAEAISDSIGENFGETKRVRKLNKLDPTAIYDVDDFGVSIKRQSAKQPKSIAQPPKPKTMKSNSEPDIIKDLRKLSDEQDQEVRQKFMVVLDQIIEEGKLKQNQRKTVDFLQNLIEANRFADAFDEFRQEAEKNAYAQKLQKNIKVWLMNQSINKRIKRKVFDAFAVNATMNNLLDQVEEDVATDMGRNKATTTIQQRMAELRARKADKKRSNSAESITSTATTAATDATDIGNVKDLPSTRGRSKMDVETRIKNMNQHLIQLKDLSLPSADRNRINTNLNYNIQALKDDGYSDLANQYEEARPVLRKK